MLRIFLRNESTALTEDQVRTIALALDLQAQRDFGRYWRGDVRCIYLAPGQSPPAGGAAILHLADEESTAGALGHHDEDGNEVPFGIVGVRTAIQYGQEPSEVASHEALELAADPHLNLTAADGHFRRLYAVEASDACQGNGYTVPVVPADAAMPVNVRVADFVLPRYFDTRTAATTPTDFRQALHGPFALGPHGYFSYLDLTNIHAGWQQDVGHDRIGPPPVDPDDRMSRRPTPGGEK
jgi:hypothetical protein